MIMRRLLLIIAALAAFTAAQAQDIVILHMNDTHSHVDPERSGKYAGMGGAIEQAAYIDEVRSEVGKKNVLLVHAGDFSQGTSYFTELGGDMEISLLNAMGYDAVALGNHEFDNGMEELARRLKNLKAVPVCANYDFTGTPLEKLVKPYTIVKKAGRKIGIIGLLPDLMDVVDASIASQITFIAPDKVVDEYAAYLKDEKGCDLVVLLSHLGYEGEPYTDRELVAVTRNVDVIVGGHSHTKLKDKKVFKNVDGEDVVVVTDWKWGLQIGRLDIDF